MTLSFLFLIAAAVCWVLATCGVTWAKFSTAQAGWTFILLAYLVGPAR